MKQLRDKITSKLQPLASHSGNLKKFIVRLPDGSREEITSDITQPSKVIVYMCYSQ